MLGWSGPGLHDSFIFLSLFRGKSDEAGKLQVEYSGCTPAYAGVEVNDVKKMMQDGITKEEADTIKKANPIDTSSHDLLASCLTIFTGVFGKSPVIVGGSEGFRVLNLYWG